MSRSPHCNFASPASHTHTQLPLLVFRPQAQRVATVPRQKRFLHCVLRAVHIRGVGLGLVQGLQHGYHATLW